MFWALGQALICSMGSGWTWHPLAVAPAGRLGRASGG